MRQNYSIDDPHQNLYTDDHTKTGVRNNCECETTVESFRELH